MNALRGLLGTEDDAQGRDNDAYRYQVGERSNEKLLRIPIHCGPLRF